MFCMDGDRPSQHWSPGLDLALIFVGVVREDLQEAAGAVGASCLKQTFGAAAARACWRRRHLTRGKYSGLRKKAPCAQQQKTHLTRPSFRLLAVVACCFVAFPRIDRVASPSL